MKAKTLAKLLRAEADNHDEWSTELWGFLMNSANLLDKVVSDDNQT